MVRFRFSITVICFKILRWKTTSAIKLNKNLISSNILLVSKGYANHREAGSQLTSRDFSRLLVVVVGGGVQKYTIN